MDKGGAPKRLRCTASLPDDIMYFIFSKLNFMEKINAGMACKRWDGLLKDGTAASRHWVVQYDINKTCLPRAPLTMTDMGPRMAELTNSIGRYLTVSVSSLIQDATSCV
jgi:hypothetical protein